MSNFSGISWIDLGATMSCGRRETVNRRNKRFINQELKLKIINNRYNLIDFLVLFLESLPSS